MGTANCWGNLSNYGEVTCDGLACGAGGVEIFLAALCYRNRGKLQQAWAVGSKAPLSKSANKLTHSLNYFEFKNPRRRNGNSIYRTQNVWDSYNRIMPFNIQNWCFCKSFRNCICYANEMIILDENPPIYMIPEKEKKITLGNFKKSLLRCLFYYHHCLIRLSLCLNMAPVLQWLVAGQFVISVLVLEH